MKIQQVYEQFASKHGLSMMKVSAQGQGPDPLGILVNGEFGQWTGYGLCFEEERLFAFFVNLGVQIPAENRSKVLMLLNEINFNLKFGGFYMDPADGELMTRSTQYLFGTEEDYAWQVENCIKVCAVIADAYYKQIMNVAFAEDSK